MRNILTGLSALFLIAAWALPSWGIRDDIVEMVYYASIFCGGIYVLVNAVRGLLRRRFFNINLLVLIACLGAIFTGELSEAAAVVLLFSLAGIFEHYGLERSRRALETLVARSPQTATLLDGKTVPVEEVKIGDVVVVRPGDTVPVDGVVSSGESSVDESAISGEPIPVDKWAKEPVFAGTTNLQGYLEIACRRVSSDSTFSKIIHLVAEAQKSRAPSQEFIDRFAQYYTPSVLAAAFLVATIPPLYTGEPLMDWVYRALILLVISCPCALVISTPVSIASAIGGASRQGVLIKGGKFLEALGRIRAIAFDKTRTLTEGKPILEKILVFGEYTEEQVLAEAAGIERFSSHPLSAAILRYAEKRGITPHEMENYEHVVGKGGKATCLVCGQVEHRIGNLKIVQDLGDPSREVLDEMRHYEGAGKTVVLVSRGQEIIAALIIGDALRDTSRSTIAALQKIGVEPYLITGDNLASAEAVARQLDISHVYASQLPEDKVSSLEKIAEKYPAVAMVGDGVNDAPSLATATVGIAMAGDGSDIAIETADVALMNDRLPLIPWSIRLGKKTLRTIKTNVALSLVVKLGTLAMAVGGWMNLDWAVGLDAGLALAVVLYSLRLFKA